MALALEQAAMAAAAGEVPVGAVVVRAGVVIGAAHNRTRSDLDPTAHAEILALRAASRHANNFRLEDCTLYCTLEPCAMCAGACLHARLQAVYFGSSEPRTGALGSVVNLFENALLNSHTQWHGGVMASACAQTMQHFFQERRSAHKSRRHTDAERWPLPDFALRTPATRFADAAPAGSYVNHGPHLSGLRMHWAHNPAGASAQTVAAAAGRPLIILHSDGAWCAQSDALRTALQAYDGAILAPDLIGCGRSDKPKRSEWHTLAAHGAALQSWAQHLQLRDAAVLIPDTDASLALRLAPALRAHIGRVVILDGRTHTLPIPGLSAPFPDAGHSAILRAAALWTASAQSDDNTHEKESTDSWWHAPQPFTLTVFSYPQDAIQGLAAQRLVCNALKQGRQGKQAKVAATPRQLSVTAAPAVLGILCSE